MRTDFIDFVAQNALRAVLYEVSVTPKPGLVDRNNSGTHNDMDFFTFIDSSAALAPHFRRFALLGAANSGIPPLQMFSNLRKPGIIAESDMYKATGGINTHKGVIFSLGTLCAAYGYLHAKEMSTDTDTVLELVTLMAKNLENELADIAPETASTNGERQYVKNRVTGIRGEVQSGFGSVKRYGLPVLKELLQKGVSINDASAITLLTLMQHVEDTNVLKYHGSEEIVDVKEKIRNVFGNSLSIENIIHLINELDKQFIMKNISYGGCADLLAVTLMLYFMEQK